MYFNIILILLIYFGSFLIADDSGKFSITRLQYRGGGDWYADPSSLPNLLKYITLNTNIETHLNEDIVKIGDDNFYKNNYYYITGHGNIKLDQNEKNILRKQLLSGAFLHVDDNYGLDQSFRKLIEEIFPEKDLIELPPQHEIFNIFYKFSEFKRNFFTYLIYKFFCFNDYTISRYACRFFYITKYWIISTANI